MIQHRKPNRKSKTLYIIFASVVLFITILYGLLRNDFGFTQGKDYYQNLRKPVMGQEQVIKRMKEERGLYENNKELVNAAKWYVFRGNKEVIRQLIKNIGHETEVELKSSDGYCYEEFVNSGASYDLLSQGHSFFEDTESEFIYDREVAAVVGPILHETLYRLSIEKGAEEGLIYVIMRLIEINEPQNGEKIILYLGKIKIYKNAEWYTTKSVCKDIYAYLKIFTRYREQPALRVMALQHLEDYYRLWLCHVDESVALTLAESKGAEYAFHFIEPCIRRGSFNSYHEAIEQITKPKQMTEPNLPFVCDIQSDIAGNWQPLEYKPHRYKLLRRDKPWLQGSYCPKCLSLRLINFWNFTERIMLSSRRNSNLCKHSWLPGVHAWSLEYLHVGDFLIVLYQEEVFCIRIDTISSNEINYSLAKISSLYSTHGMLDLSDIEWENKTGCHFQIKDRTIYVKILEESDDSKAGISIWYDYYYGGFPEKANFENSEVLMAIVHESDLQEKGKIHLNRYRFKSWEDGLGNTCGYY